MALCILGPGNPPQGRDSSLRACNTILSSIAQSFLLDCAAISQDIFFYGLIDYAIIGIVGFSALISLVRGFLKEAMSLVTWFVAFFIASHFYPDLAVYFTSFSDAMVRNGLAIAALFVATLILGAW
jgi:hypothetical protein